MKSNTEMQTIIGTHLDESKGKFMLAIKEAQDWQQQKERYLQKEILQKLTQFEKAHIAEVAALIASGEMAKLNFMHFKVPYVEYPGMILRVDYHPYLLRHIYFAKSLVQYKCIKCEASTTMKGALQWRLLAKILACAGADALECNDLFHKQFVEHKNNIVANNVQKEKLVLDQLQWDIFTGEVQ